MISMGHRITTNVMPRAGYGTVGCFIKPTNTGAGSKHAGVYLLTNCHVITNGRNNVGFRKNTWVRNFHDGRDIASVTWAYRQWWHKQGWVDYAVCKLKPAIEWENKCRAPGGDERQLVSKWIDWNRVEGQVHKDGATTDVTRGRIDGMSLEPIGYLDGYPNHVPENMGLVSITGRDYLLPGDSGSVTLDNDNRIVCLNFASDGQIQGLAIPFRRVLDHLYNKTCMTWDIA